MEGLQSNNESEEIRPSLVVELIERIKRLRLRSKQSGTTLRESTTEEDAQRAQQILAIIASKPSDNKRRIVLDKNVFNFLSLPAELRHKIYRFLIKQKHPLAANSSFVECDAEGCGLNMETYQTRAPIELLMTCKEIHIEYGIALYKFGNFAVQTMSEIWDPVSAVSQWNKHLFDTKTRSQFAFYIRHLDFRINLAPGITIKTQLSNLEPLMPTLEISASAASEVLNANLGDYFTCYRYRLVFEHLSRVQQVDLPHLRLISIAIKVHYHSSRTPQCKAFQLLFRLGANEKSSRTPTEDAPEQASEINLTDLEPRRQLLVPLGRLETLSRIDLRRCWNLRWETQKGQPFGQKCVYWRESRYNDLNPLLVKAGVGFANFLKSPMELKHVPKVGRHGDVEWRCFSESFFFYGRLRPNKNKRSAANWAR